MYAPPPIPPPSKIIFFSQCAFFSPMNALFFTKKHKNNPFGAQQIKNDYFVDEIFPIHQKIPCHTFYRYTLTLYHHSLNRRIQTQYHIQNIPPLILIEFMSKCFRRKLHATTYIYIIMKTSCCNLELFPHKTIMFSHICDFLRQHFLKMDPDT